MARSLGTEFSLASLHAPGHDYPLMPILLRLLRTNCPAKHGLGQVGVSQLLAPRRPSAPPSTELQARKHRKHHQASSSQVQFGSNRVAHLNSRRIHSCFLDLSIWNGRVCLTCSTCTPYGVLPYSAHTVTPYSVLPFTYIMYGVLTPD
jgi:hypothetical protein